MAPFPQLAEKKKSWWIKFSKFYIYLAISYLSVRNQIFQPRLHKNKAQKQNERTARNVHSVFRYHTWCQESLFSTWDLPITFNFVNNRILFYFYLSSVFTTCDLFVVKRRPYYNDIVFFASNIVRGSNNVIKINFSWCCAESTMPSRCSASWKSFGSTEVNSFTAGIRCVRYTSFQYLLEVPLQLVEINADTIFAPT
jgi:hypothetical protein